MTFLSNCAATVGAVCIVAAALPSLAAGTPDSTAQPAASPRPLASPSPIASPSPSASATPSGIADPCTSLLAVVTRPTISTAACNVKRGTAFLETGYLNTTTTGSGANGVVSYPNAEVRTGLIGSALELDFFAPSFERQSIGGATFTGLSDAGFGLKTQAGYTAKAIYGAYVNVFVPTGDAAFTAGLSQFQYGINYAYAVTPAFALGSTLQYDQLAGVNASGIAQRYGTFIPSVVGTLSLPMNSQAFAEVAHYLKAGPGLPPRTFFDAGLQHDIGSFVQLDIEYGTNFNAVAGAKTHYVGAGAAFRFGP